MSRASLRARARDDIKESMPVVAAVSRGDGIDQERCLVTARRMADRLSEIAYRDGNRVGWLGISSRDGRRSVIRPLGNRLYDGYPGVALFLAELGRLTGDEQYATTVRRALTHVPTLLETLPGPTANPAPNSTMNPASEPPGCGPFYGVTGLAYAAVHVAASVDDPALLDSVLPPIAAAAMAAIGDVPDVVGGMAGCIAAMHTIDAAIDAPPARQVAQAAARWLVSRTFPDDDLAWRADSAGPPIGFARGASGIGWALLRHAAATGDRRSSQAGLAALRYERARYLPGLPPNAGGWCRGAAGIGLARADSLHAGGAEVAADLELAVRAVLAAGPLADHSLCHGELGALELLTVAIESGRSDLEWARGRRAATLLDALERSGPRCGTPGGVEAPGLLTGLAGIGYGLLRLAFPDRVPSVLLLQPPRSRPPSADGSETGSSPTPRVNATQKATADPPKSNEKKRKDRHATDHDGKDLAPPGQVGRSRVGFAVRDDSGGGRGRHRARDVDVRLGARGRDGR